MSNIFLPKKVSFLSAFCEDIVFHLGLWELIWQHYFSSTLMTSSSKAQIVRKPGLRVS